MKFLTSIASGLILTVCSGLPLAAQTKAFTISAANVTMPLSGNGSAAYTVANIPMTGQLGITCQYSGPATTAKIPTCGGGPIFSMSVTAGQTVTGTINLYPYGVGVPAAARNELPGSGLARGFALALAVPLLLGLGRWRKIGRWLALVVVGVMALSGLSACGGDPNAMTPGTYPYTITANNEASPNTPLGQGVSTTMNVTVR